MLWEYRNGRTLIFEKGLRCIDDTAAGPLQYAYWQSNLGKDWIGKTGNDIIKIFGMPDDNVENSIDIINNNPGKYDEILHYGEYGYPCHSDSDETENLYFCLQNGKVAHVETLFP